MHRVSTPNRVISTKVGISQMHKIRPRAVFTRQSATWSDSRIAEDKAGSLTLKQYAYGEKKRMKST
jgi:hypothetical protein